MKNLLLFIPLVLMISCSKEVPSDQLLERNGLLYEINSQEPFTGFSVEFWSNGNLKEKRKIKEGKFGHLYSGKDFLWEKFYENGQLDFRYLHNFSQEYHPNGQLKSLTENKITTNYNRKGEILSRYERMGKKPDEFYLLVDYEDGVIESKSCRKIIGSYELESVDMSYCEK